MSLESVSVPLNTKLIDVFTVVFYCLVFRRTEYLLLFFLFVCFCFFFFVFLLLFFFFFFFFLLFFFLLPFLKWQNPID